MHLHIIPRSVAVERKLSHYFTGTPCKRNGIAIRTTLKSRCLCGACTAALGETKRRSAEKYADVNRKKQAEYREANRDLINARNRERYAKDPAGVGGKIRDWQRKNPEKKTAYQKKWDGKNPEAVAAKSQRRRAKLLEAGGVFNGDDIRRLLKLQRGLCACCETKLKLSGTNKYHIDHIHPVSKGGSNSPDNLQLLCPPCNRTKSAKDPYEFAASLGRLL